MVTDALGDNDRKLIKRIIEFGHTSTLEHSLITYKVSGISRAVLQEISRHRVGVSPSVESTRYTFKRILREGNVADYLVSTGNKELDQLNIDHMNKVKELAERLNMANDFIKYGIVEAYKLTEMLSFNFRSLRHFYKLRTSNKALWEIQDVAYGLVNALPMKYSVFFEDLE